MATPTSVEPVISCVSTTPVPLYRVDRLLLLSAIQKGKPGATAIPQGFDRFASMVVVVATTPTLFDAKAESVKPVDMGGSVAMAVDEVPPTAPPPHATRLNVHTTATAANARVSLLILGLTTTLRNLRNK
jgi:hypothetical protein